jgi:membrane associated rhomboid family serine protease
MIARMSYHDRDYVREGRAEFRWRGRVVLWLVGVTVAGYLAEAIALQADVDVLSIFGVVPERVTDGWIWQLVTHAFLHDPRDRWHILANLLFLYLLGSDVSEMYGARVFLSLYFGSAVACALAFTAVAYASGRPDAVAVGASGAIYGVAVVAVFLFPTRPMPFIPVPLWFVLALFVGLEVFRPVAGTRPWLDSAGHLGGVLFGAAFHFFKLDGMRLWPRRRRARRAAPDSGVVDRLLEKISREGIASLTPQEQETLRRAAK